MSSKLAFITEVQVKIHIFISEYFKATLFKLCLNVILIENAIILWLKRVKKNYYLYQTVFSIKQIV